MEGVERPLPVVDDESRAFWEAGRDGVLRFSACRACGALLHPPVPVCRYCRSGDIGGRDVSGRGVVVGVTVNHHQWDPRFSPPFVIATVAIEEDPRVRVVTNLVDVAPDEVRVGMRVKARFEARRTSGSPCSPPWTNPTPPFPTTRSRPASTGVGRDRCSAPIDSRTGSRLPGSVCPTSAGASCARRCH